MGGLGEASAGGTQLSSSRILLRRPVAWRRAAAVGLTPPAGIVARSVTVADAVEPACWGIAAGSLLSGEVTQCA